MTTLVITAVASAAAAYACSKVWAPGTLLSAAFTPVLVAIIKEGIRRPTEVVTRAVPPVRGVVRSSRGRGRGEAPPPRRDLADEEPTRVAQPGLVGGARPSPPRSVRWRLAVITGLLGFVLAAVVLTVPELVAGGSAAGGGRQTTLFGGGTKSRKHERTTPTVPTTSAPARPAAPPQPTVAPPTRTAPVPTTTTPPPASKTPAPTTATPAPPAPITP